MMTRMARGMAFCFATRNESLTNGFGRDDGDV
jgi:hypothetical protein